jgi:splicing factor 3B subunit 3
MFLYSLTIQKPTAVTSAVAGSFSAPKVQEIAIAKGKILELLRPDDNGKVNVVYSSEVFANIRSLCTFRLPGICSFIARL